MRPIIKLPSEKIYLFESYDSLRYRLLESVGAYCAYCETPITIDFPVSTKVSVSDVNYFYTIGNNKFAYTIGIQPRWFTKAWVNQQTTCSACAAAKANQLGSAEGFLQLSITNPARFNQLTSGRPRHRLRLTNDDAEDVFIAAIQTWVWPDESSDETGLIVLPGDPTFDLFTYQETSRTQLDLAANNLVRLTDDEKLEAWASKVEDGIWVIPNTAYIQQNTPNIQAAQALTQRVTNTILGLNLNYCNTSSPTFADRRVVNRKATMATIKIAINHLNTVVNQTKTANDLKNNQRDAEDVDDDLYDLRVNTLLGFIRETLRATGFWSLWVRVFTTTINSQNDPLWSHYSSRARQQLFYRLFVEYEIDLRNFVMPKRASKNDPIPQDSEIEEIGSQMVIPGTDVNRLSFLQ